MCPGWTLPTHGIFLIRQSYSTIIQKACFHFLSKVSTMVQNPWRLWTVSYTFYSVVWKILTCCWCQSPCISFCKRTLKHKKWKGESIGPRVYLHSQPPVRCVSDNPEKSSVALLAVWGLLSVRKRTPPSSHPETSHLWDICQVTLRNLPWISLLCMNYSLLRPPPSSHCGTKVSFCSLNNCIHFIFHFVWKQLYGTWEFGYTLISIVILILVILSFGLRKHLFFSVGGAHRKRIQVSQYPSDQRII